MSGEEMKHNEEARQESKLSSDGLLTYRRRKRVRSGESSHAQEDTAFSVDEEASASRYGNKKDIGWEHGKPVDGNRYHWKCKYCDFVGQSGGVTRLKKHLAGGWHVTTCLKVPKHISAAMNEHLRELKKSKLSKGKKREREVDTREEDNFENYIEENEMNTGSPYQESSPDNFEHNESNMEVPLTSYFISSQVNGKDFGWEHGKTVNGNRYHWKCKWCNFIGRSGGVTRLKKHLAGGWNVTSCTMVPQHIANAMNNHLMELRKKRLFKNRRMDLEVEYGNIDDTPLAPIPCTEVVEEELGVLQLTNGNEERFDKTSKSGYSDNGHRSRQELVADMAKALGASQKSKRSIRRCSRNGNQRSRDFYKRLNNVAEQTRNFTAKASPYDKCQYTDICEGQYSTTRTNDHWRNVLEHILQLPEIKGADSIERSIKDALMHGHPAKNNVNYSEITEPRDKLNHVDVLNNGIHNQMLEAIANKKKCQDILSKVLCSEKFILLCNLLSESFPGLKVDSVFDFRQINKKMKTGVYGQSPRLFILDIQQMWRNLEKVGEEITNIASSLSNLSRDLSSKQVEEDIIHESSSQKCEDNHEATAAVLPNNFSHSTPNTTLPDLNQTDPSPPPKTCLSLALPSHTNNTHNNCGVCTRLDTPEDHHHHLPLPPPPPPPHQRLCKQCGTCEDSDRRFITCGHSQCPYKYYHIRCLKSGQIATLQQQQEKNNRGCWYCPSCLCRGCFKDRDDDLIVLCDGCDEAYHTYCMKPAMGEVPKGRWYCLGCNVAKAKEGMRRYEDWVLRQHKGVNKDHDDDGGCLDVLLRAVDTLEER